MMGYYFYLKWNIYRRVNNGSHHDDGVSSCAIYLWLVMSFELISECH